jgi:hypothetical protein
MGVFDMIAFVVLIVMVSVVIMVSVSARSKNQRARGANAEADERIQALEERVRVLEKLATDRSARLREEIDAL